jgi:MoaA/NifB/PqqE/SkfB family radical SAM enzyme
MKYIRDFDPSYHSILLLRGDPADEAYRLPDYPVIDDIKRGAFKIFESYGYGGGRMTEWISRNYQQYLWDLSIKTLKEERQVIPCLGGQAHVVVYANGDMAPCELLPVVGNIRHQSYQDILKGDAWHQAVKSIQNNECFCTHNCNMVENILFNPKTYPNLVGISTL